MEKILLTCIAMGLDMMLVLALLQADFIKLRAFISSSREG